MHGGIISRWKLAGLNALAVAALILAACTPQGATGTPGAAGGQTTAQTPVRTPGVRMTPMRTPGAVTTPMRTPGAAQTPAAMAANIVTLNQRGQSIAVVEPSTLRVTEQIPLGFMPGNMALSPDGRFAWVTHAAMPVGATPTAQMTPAGTPGAAMTPTPATTPAAGTPTAMPAGAAANMVSVIDLTTGQRVDDVQLSGAPGHIVTSADGQLVFVGARSGDFVMVVDAGQRTETQRISLGEQPEGMAFVMATMAAAQMTPGATPATQMTPGATPTGMQTPGATPAGTPTAMMTPGATPRAAMTPGADGATRGVLLVTLPRASAVSVIDPQQLREIARVSITAPNAQQVMGPTTVFASATGDRIFATGGQMTTVGVLDLTTNQVRMIDLQNVTPVTGASSPQGDLVVVVPRTGNQVLMVDVDAGRVLDQIEVGQNPRSATFTQDGQRVLVANEGDNTLSVIDVSTRTVAQTVQVGEGPVEVAQPPEEAAPAPAGA